MFRIPRQYVLLVAPVALIIILMPGSMLWEEKGNGGFPSSAVQLGLLSAWLWLQWPRKKLAYVSFVFAVSVFCLVPVLLTVVDTLERGEIRLDASLCDCWIAILVSTALAIAARLILPWRFVDAQSNDDASHERDARGSIFDLIVAVSACAIAFALFRYRLENDFAFFPEHPIVPAVLAAASTFSAVAFLRLFAPLNLFLQILIFLLAAPLMIGATWVALNAVGAIVGFEGDLLANAVAPPACAGVFAMVASLCGLRFGGFEIRGLGSHVSQLVANFACLSIVAVVVLFINTLPYGTHVDEEPGLIGWPFSQAVSVQTWRFGPLLGNITLGVAATLSFGLGIPCLIRRFLSRRRHDPKHAVPVWHRATTWSALICVCILASVALSILNVRRLRAEAGLEKRLSSSEVLFVQTPYTLHLMDRLTAAAAQSLGFDVPDEVITRAVISKSIERRQLHEICSLSELRSLNLSNEVEEIQTNDVERLIRSNRLQTLVFACPDLNASVLKAITTIRSLEGLSIAAPFPDVPVKFQESINSLAVNLRQNSKLVEFPGRLKELVIKVSNTSDLSGLRNDTLIDYLKLNCRHRTIPMKLHVDRLQQFVLHHGQSGLSLSLRGESLYDLHFVAARDPNVPGNPKITPHIDLEFGGRYDGHQLFFQDASCFLRTPDPDFEGATLHLRETKEVSLAQQLEKLSASPKWSLVLDGRVNQAACEQLARLTELRHLTINCTPQPAGIPFDILNPGDLSQLTGLEISGVAVTQKQFDGLLRAATGLETIDIDGSRILSVDLRNHSGLVSLVATNSPGLSEVEFGSEIPIVFVVTGDSEADPDFVINGKGFDRDALEQIFSDENATWVQVEDRHLDPKVWNGLDFGPHLTRLEIADYPSSELYESWVFGERFNILAVKNSREPPAHLLPALFKNAGPDLYVDLSVEPYPYSPEGHVLSLTGREITDEIIDAIARIESLAELNLWETGVTTGQVEELRRRCPWIETIKLDEGFEGSGSVTE